MIALFKMVTFLTLCASVFRIRALSDLESQLNSLRPEYQSIKKALSEVSSQKEHPDPAEEELDFLWEETERAVSDRWVLDQS